MSRTYRKFPWGYFRYPRGSKQAQSAIEAGNGGRRRAIPPDDYDDIPAGRETHLPRKLAQELYDQGRTEEEILKILKGTFHYPQAEAADCVRWIFKGRRG